MGEGYIKLNTEMEVEERYKNPWILVYEKSFLHFPPTICTHLELLYMHDLDAIFQVNNN